MQGTLLLTRSAALALFCCLASFAALAATIFPQEPLTITRQDGKKLSFTVELATSEELRRQGLMNRPTMPADRGMLFDFETSRNVYMWMKNTYLPLDMLFISESGRIEHIRADTLPLSEDVIASRVPVRFVLELNAGSSFALGISVGDQVSSALVDAASARP